MKKAKLEKEMIGAWCLALAHLYHGGVSWGDAFVLMAEDEQEVELSQLLSSMAIQADQGASLAQVLQETGRFPEYVCGLIQVGEQTGKIEECLLALSDFYSRRSRMEKQIKTALLYPMVLLGVLMAVVLLLLVWVLPIFEDVYQQLGSQLTGLAGGLLLFGAFLRKMLPVLGALVVIVGTVVFWGSRHPKYQKKFLKLWQNEQIQEARFVQALSLGLQSGMLPQEAVSLAMGLVDADSDFQKRCQECLDQLDGGELLPVALQKAGLLGKADGRLYEYARKAGKGEEMMTQIAERLLEESELAWENRLARIEPTLIVLMSILVGTILCSVLLPLIHMIAAIG